MKGQPIEAAGDVGLGAAVPRYEDLRLVRGGGKYVDDVRLPGMAFGHVLRPPHSHARIVSLDVSRARAAAGVLVVLTWEDWRAAGYRDLPAANRRKRRDGSPMYVTPYPALVNDRVRWNGDTVAFVVAETLAQAMDAAELIEVEYEPLAANVSTEDALRPDTPLVWEDCPGNICFVHTEGDKAAVEAAFARAHHVARGKFTINRVTAAPMETRGCVGHYDAASDRYTLYAPHQRGAAFRTELARTLRIPETALRVIAGDIGGSFGMKSGVQNEAPLALFTSRLTGRPVKWTSTRSEAFLSDPQGRDNVTTAALALDASGEFLALRVETIANLGAHAQPGADTGAVNNLGSLAGVYTIPAIHVDVTAVLTNTNPIRPYRGNGRPEASYVIERIVDVAADGMRIDPAELRRRNIIPPDAMPYQTALAFRYDCGEFERNLDLALAAADYAGFEARRAAARTRGKLRGIGIANVIERAAAPGFEGAEIRFDRAGTATIFSGAVSQGQGHETVFKQLVCGRLGLAPDEVRYVAGDSDQVFFGEGTGGSRSATMGGAALEMAAGKIVAKAKAIAAHMLAVVDVEFDAGLFSSRSSNRSLSIGEIAVAAANPKNLPRGMEPGLVATAVYTSEVESFPNGCHVCELEIEEETGAVELLAYSVVDDVGTVLNPLMLKGQIHGGVAQGIGQILMEDLTFDPETGQLIAGSFMDYAVPRASDLCAIRVESNPVPTRTNPLGSKGAGEAGSVGALPAVANALVDALSVYGIRHVDMPATPERLWRIIRDAKAAAIARSPAAGG